MKGRKHIRTPYGNLEIFLSLSLCSIDDKNIIGIGMHYLLLLHAGFLAKVDCYFGGLMYVCMYKSPLKRHADM